MQIILVSFVLSIVASCSTSTREIFFDIPPPVEQPPAGKQVVPETTSVEAGVEDRNLLFPVAPGNQQPRPEIEKLRYWQDAVELLPRDYKGKPDWSAALEQGIIRPRPGSDIATVYASLFQWDFIMEADKPRNEAYFPHSAHTKWLSCNNCHMSIYTYKRNPATMKEMKKGASCGTCHGKNNVAFSLRQCKRCHLNR